MTDKQYTFNLEDIFFPSIISKFSYNAKNKNKKKTLNISYKIVLEIVSLKKIEVFFGIQILPGDSRDEKDVTLVEVLGIFNFSDEVFKNEITSIDSIKALPNMLAILLPFIREKIHTCFYNNKIIFYLPSINTFKLVEDLKDKIQVIDKRSKAD